MNTKPERLDKDGFPIPGGFEAIDPGATPRASRAGGVRRVLRWIVLAGLLSAAWVHFDVGKKARNAVADYLFQEAIRQYYQNDLTGALRSLDRAVSWAPHKGQAIMVRMQVHLELKNFQPALDDSLRAAELNQDDDSWIGGRLMALHGLGRHREAAAFCGEMLVQGAADRTMLLNSRAYARALGGFELNEGLADIKEVLANEGVDVDDDDGEQGDGEKGDAEKGDAGVGGKANAGDADAGDGAAGKKGFQIKLPFGIDFLGDDDEPEMDPENASYIDTRGYLLLKLGKTKEALADFDLAIALTELRIAQLVLESRNAAARRIPHAVIERRAKNLDEGQAVMYHHRGEALEKLGKREEAEKAFEIARKFGFDETKGVY